MEDLEEMFVRMRSNDELDGDLTSLNAVKWDRVEFDKDGDRIGYDDVTGQSYSLGPMPTGCATRNSVKYFAFRRRGRNRRRWQVF